MELSAVQFSFSAPQLELFVSCTTDVMNWSKAPDEF